MIREPYTQIIKIDFESHKKRLKAYHVFLKYFEQFVVTITAFNKGKSRLNMIAKSKKPQMQFFDEFTNSVDTRIVKIGDISPLLTRLQNLFKSTEAKLNDLYKKHQELNAEFKALCPKKQTFRIFRSSKTMPDNEREIRVKNYFSTIYSPGVDALKVELADEWIRFDLALEHFYRPLNTLFFQIPNDATQSAPRVTTTSTTTTTNNPFIYWDM